MIGKWFDEMRNEVRYGANTYTITDPKTRYKMICARVHLIWLDLKIAEGTHGHLVGMYRPSIGLKQRCSTNQPSDDDKKGRIPGVAGGGRLPRKMRKKMKPDDSPRCSFFEDHFGRKLDVSESPDTLGLEDSEDFFYFQSAAGQQPPSVLEMRHVVRDKKELLGSTGLDACVQEIARHVVNGAKVVMMPWHELSDRMSDVIAVENNNLAFPGMDRSGVGSG